MKYKATQLACDWGQFAAAEVFREPEQLLEAFSSTPRVGFAVFDNQLRYQAINQALVEINGMPAEAHLGKTVRKVFGDAIAERVEPAFERVLATGQRLQFEITAKLPSRAEVSHWVNNCVPLRDTAGRVTKLGVVIVEVTNRKRLEQSVPYSSRKLRIADEEQSRVARQLHDSFNQYHAALRMNLGLLRRACRPDEGKALLAQSVGLLEQCISETQMISYLLHPHSLDEKGVGPALELALERDYALLEQEPGIESTERSRPLVDSLTAREREVLQLLAEGMINKEVAARLNISVRTVENHRAAMMAKLHLRAFSQLVRYAIRNGIVEA
jgi:PAS domain S-box-containing protein